MEIRKINDKKTWNDFLFLQHPNTFLQSWEWKLVQEADGDHVQTLGFYTQEGLVGVALLITVQAKRGIHYLCPHGPIVKKGRKIKRIFPACWAPPGRGAGFMPVQSVGKLLRLL